MLRLLHLSDIHFHDYTPGAKEVDLDAEVRERLLVDLSALVTRTGPCDAVLVVGDVGARGLGSDYQEAATFLESVTELVGCEADRVICVPGNHDINRGAHDPIHDALRLQLRTCDSKEINDTLLTLLRDESAAGVLLRPFDAYNEFALRFGCDIRADALTWTPKTLPLGSRDLVVHGITSAWVADASDDETTDSGKLVAGAFQCIPVRNGPGRVEMTLCHHPSNWLRDGAELDGWSAAAHLMLTGHEHSFGVQVDEHRRWVRIASGAVNPARSEDGWFPAYNLIELDPVEEGDDELHLRVYVRSWQDGGFGADRRFADPQPVDLDLNRERTSSVEEGTDAPRPLNEIERSHGHTVLTKSSPDRRRAIAKELGMPETPSTGLEGDRAILEWAAESGNLSVLAARLLGESIDG